MNKIITVFFLLIASNLLAMEEKNLEETPLIIKNNKFSFFKKKPLNEEKLTEKHNKKLIKAVQKGNIYKIDDLIAIKPNSINIKDHEGRSLAQIAKDHNQDFIVTALADWGKANLEELALEKVKRDLSDVGIIKL